MSSTKKAQNKSGQSWTLEEEALLYELKWNGLTYAIISSQLGRSIYSCEKKYRNTDWTKKPFYDTAKRRLRDNYKQALVDKVSSAKDQKLHASVLQSEILADRLESVVVSLPRVNKTVYKRSENKNKTKHLPEDVGLIISDAHIGHHHTLEETGGLSEYNLDIFKSRVEFLKSTTADIVELHSKLYDLPNLHIFCPGDMVAGMNSTGAWSATYINMCILDQAVEGAEALADMIYYWLGLFDNIYFYGVYGNHGRAAPRGIEKEYVNWDYITYKFLEAKFSQNPRVKFVIPKAWWSMQTIRNHKFLLIHGEDVRGSTAIRGLSTYTDHMIGIIKDIPEYVIAGHFHSAAELSTNYGRLILNGSFIGGEIYSLKDLQKSSKPEQKIFGIHDRRGLTWMYNIDLSHAQ